MSLAATANTFSSFRTTLLFLLLLCLPIVAKSQNVQLKVYYNDPCSGEIVPESFFQITGRDRVTHMPDSLTSIVSVKEPGNYRLLIQHYNPMPQSVWVDLVEGINTYTYNREYIRQALRMHQAPVYICCDSLCEGYQQDYYPNGNLRISGSFRKGQPADTLTFFSENGNIAQQEIHQHKRNIYLKFDEEGKITEKSDYVNGVGKHFTFYRDGQLKIETAWKKINGYSKEYYADGVLASMETDNKYEAFYPDGSIKKVVTRRKINRLENFCWDKLLFWCTSYCMNFIDYRYKFKEYDRGGDLKYTATIEDYAVDFNFITSPKDGSWIVKLVYKEDGEWKVEKHLGTKHLGTKHLKHVLD